MCALVDSVALEMVKAAVDSATSGAAAGENDRSETFVNVRAHEVVLEQELVGLCLSAKGLISFFRYLM